MRNTGLESGVPAPATGGGGAGLRPAGAVAGQGPGDPWSERAALYVESDAHREGADLDLLVEWAAGARTALDVATGGGHVARRLREAGLQVVTSDPAPGMQPDVICPAEHLPFADSSFDVVACRTAAHHFDDVPAAIGEMARVSAGRVLLVDTLNMGEAAEEAERLRDPSHVRNYDEAEWRGFVDGAGLRVEELVTMPHRIDFAAWLKRTGCEGEEAELVRELWGDRVAEGRLNLDKLALKAVKA
jgi:SAM-dependent methyltransferase